MTDGSDTRPNPRRGATRALRVGFATLLVGAMLVLFDLVITAPGTPAFPVVWSVPGLPPWLAGLVAVSMLRTRADRPLRPARELTSA